MGPVMIVVDANVIACFFLEGETTELARRLSEVDAQWIAPEIWRHEFANVLVSTCLFSGLAAAEAQRIWREAAEIMRGGEYSVDMADVLRLAVGHSATAYDAECIFPARSLRAVCVTEDRRLRKAFPAETMSMCGFLKSGGDPRTVREAGVTYRTRRQTRRQRDRNARRQGPE